MQRWEEMPVDRDGRICGAVELVFEFPMGTSGRGWANFIPKKALQDPTLGYIKDGWLTLIAHVSLLGMASQQAGVD